MRKRRTTLDCSAVSSRMGVSVSVSRDNSARTLGSSRSGCCSRSRSSRTAVATSSTGNSVKAESSSEIPPSMVVARSSASEAVRSPARPRMTSEAPGPVRAGTARSPVAGSAAVRMARARKRVGSFACLTTTGALYFASSTSRFTTTVGTCGLGGGVVPFSSGWVVRTTAWKVTSSSVRFGMVKSTQPPESPAKASGLVASSPASGARGNPSHPQSSSCGVSAGRLASTATHRRGKCLSSVTSMATGSPPPTRMNARSSSSSGQRPVT